MTEMDVPSTLATYNFNSSGVRKRASGPLPTETVIGSVLSELLDSTPSSFFLQAVKKRQLKAKDNSDLCIFKRFRIDKF